MKQKLFTLNDKRVESRCRKPPTGKMPNIIWDVRMPEDFTNWRNERKSYVALPLTFSRLTVKSVHDLNSWFSVPAKDFQVIQHQFGVVGIEERRNSIKKKTINLATKFRDSNFLYFDFSLAFPVSHHMLQTELLVADWRWTRSSLDI